MRGSPFVMSGMEASLVTEHKGGCIEISWFVPYFWSKVTPATRDDPEEGGLELDGDPWPVSVTFYGNLSDNSLTIGGIEVGSYLEITIMERFAPSEAACLQAAEADLATHLEDTRY